jgi:DNA-binding Xre family transcriptional regulator
MALRNIVKEFLEERKITAYQFVKETGISGTTGYELARNPWHIPSTGSIAKICDTYKIQPSEIVVWVGNE